MFDQRLNFARRLRLALLIVLGLILTASPAWAGTKNVIVMITDGGGFNQWRMASFYNGTFGKEIYDSPRKVSGKTYPWTLYGCTNYSVGGSYDPAKYDPNSPDFDTQYGKSGATDSAAAATTWNTGMKTSNGNINYNTDDTKPLYCLGQFFAAHGRSVGNVSSVSLGHATPACVWSHNVSRGNGDQIWAEMANSPADSGLVACIAPGHPYYDNNGKPSSKYKAYYSADREDWDKMAASTAGQFNGWTFTDKTNDIQAYASGSKPVPKRLFAVVPINGTLQEKRSGKGASKGSEVFDPKVTTVPTLAECAVAALRVVSQNEKGFYLQIEGGAIDWACHSNQTAREIEEQTDFVKTIEAVVQWVETYSSWDDTLLIITADHETGMIRGPKFKSNPKDYFVIDRGKGNIPGYTWNSGSHTNDIVPLYTIGAGSELFKKTLDGHDKFRDVDFVDNTDIFHVISETTGQKHPQTR